MERLKAHVPGSLLARMDRPLPSLDNIFTEYKDVLDEKFHREIELENELQINKDFTLELEHLQAVMSDNSALSVDKLQQHIEQLQSIKKTHEQLKNAVEKLEEKLANQQQGIELKKESIKSSAKKEQLAEEKEFKRKLMEIDNQFAAEAEEIRSELAIKAERLEAAKQKSNSEFLKSKDDLRKSLTNKLKISNTHHIDCVSKEMDLKKQIILLEKDFKELELMKAKRKSVIGNRVNGAQQRSSPNRSVSQQQETRQPSPSGEGARKRKLFSHSAVGSNFMGW